MISVRFDPDRNALYVSGVMTPFPAGSLEARRLGDMLAVANPHEDALVCAWVRFDGWAVDGVTGFASAEQAFAALQRACTAYRPNGDVTIPIRAAIPLGGHRVIRAAPDGARYASVDLAESAGTVVGVTTAAVEAEAETRFVSQGKITEPSWGWSLGPIYCGLNGDLSQSPPAGLFEQQIATAIAADTIIVRLDPHIFLAPRS